MTSLQSIKVNQTIAAQRAAAGTILTTSANAYAILSLYTTALTGNLQVNVGGERVLDAAAETAGPYGPGLFRQIVVGPSTQIDIVQNSGGQTVYVSGVELINTT